MSSPRFAIGIDLGTTHSALAWVDIAGSDGEATVHGTLPIPQLTAPGEVDFVIPTKEEELALRNGCQQKCGTAKMTNSTKSTAKATSKGRVGLPPSDVGVTIPPMKPTP